MAFDVAMLFVPGAAERRFRTIDRLAGLSFILDLEDSVPPAEKDRARELVGRLVASRGNRTALHVRVNPPDGSTFATDLAAVVRPGLQGIVLPKVEAADDVRRCDEAIGDGEARHGLDRGSVGLMATIESVTGLMALREIASASPRLRRLCFGAADFARDLGLDWPDPSGLNPTILHGKIAVVLASRAAGLDRPHDGAYTWHRDPDGLRREATESRRLGFGGKHVIHPDQIPIVADAFRPTAEQLERAAYIVEAFDLAVARGEAAVDVGGEMVDYAIASRARMLLNADGSVPG